MRRVALIQNPSSRYGVLGAMTEALGAAFARMGIQASISDGNVEKIIQAGDLPDCSWGINTLLDENVLFRPFGIMHVDLSVDTFIHSIPYALHLPHLIQLFVDGDSCEHFISLGGERVCWFPHAIAQETIDLVRSERDIPLSDRPYDVTLLGSHFPKSAWLDSSEGAVKPLREVIHQALADLSYPFFSEAFNAIALNSQLEHVDAVGLLTVLETALRRAYRERILNVLHGSDIHIFTGREDAESWGKEGGRYFFHPPVDFHDVIRVCCQSKAVINSSPHIRPGYHERLFLSLASGAVTVVERGRLPRWLSEEGRVVEYDSGSLESVPRRIEEARRCPYNREKVLSWLSSEHTWDVRLRRILPVIECLLKNN